MEKNYVGMVQCFFCGEPKAVVLDRRLKKTLPRLCVYDYEPCDDCQKWMKQGIILVSVKNGTDRKNPHRTGRFVVVTDEFITRCFNDADAVLKTRFACVEDAVWDAVKLPK